MGKIAEAPTTSRTSVPPETLVRPTSRSGASRTPVSRTPAPTQPTPSRRRKLKPTRPASRPSSRPGPRPASKKSSRPTRRKAARQARRAGNAPTPATALKASGSRTGETITIVGPGRLGRTLALALQAAGCRIAELMTRDDPASVARAQPLARRLGARMLVEGEAVSGSLVWITVPDDSLPAAAKELALSGDWRNKIVLHASGALAASVLDPLRARGARIASAHPLNSFVTASKPDLRGVPFALEGEEAALTAAQQLIRRLGAEAFRIDVAHKPLYHAFGAFVAPMLVSLLSAAEKTGREAGLADPRKVMEVILRQTVENCLRNGPANSFSGPLLRGDVETVRRHLRVLEPLPAERAVYLALARYALHHLPVARKPELRELLD